MHNTALEELEEYRFQATLNNSANNNNNSLFFELGESQMKSPMSPRVSSMDYEEGGEGEERLGRKGNWTIPEEDDDVFEETDKLLKEDVGSIGETMKENKYKKVGEWLRIDSDIMEPLHYSLVVNGGSNRWEHKTHIKD